MSLSLKVPSMSCGGCVSTITKAVHSVDPQAEVNVNLQTKTVQVETSLTAPVVSKALAQAGYPTT